MTKGKKAKKAIVIPLEQKLVLAGIGFFHLVGAGLLMFGKGFLYDLAQTLTPANLLLTTLLVLKYQAEYSRGFFIFLFSAFLIGFCAELAGVHTGILFGFYTYGEVLGIKIWDTPLVIGINWFLLAYCLGNLLSELKLPSYILIIAGTLGMVGFDYFMEPVALMHGFWSWEGGTIPLKNYQDWALVSFILMCLFSLLSFKKSNWVAGRVWLIQLGFFLIQNIL